MASLRKHLPAGYRLETGGAVEESAKGLGSIVAVAPFMALAMLTLLFFQLQNVSRVLLVVAVAPLGLIGVVLAMLPTGTPMGFITILGVISLAGMIIRNAVILIDQIDTYVAAEQDRGTAVVEATLHRLRPILLTALAAILGMVPIAFEVFWGPMAFAVMGGLSVATVLTLLFLPALYVTWFRIAPRPLEGREAAITAEAAPVAA